MEKRFNQNSGAIGSLVETRALKMLRRVGLALLARNFRCRFGEIDLIMQDEATIVFVEVRHRATAGYGRAAETVDRAKQRRLRITAQYFLTSRGLGEAHVCRFDVITSDGRSGSLRWLRSAF